MTIALDIGSHHVRSLRHQAGRLIARSQRAAYAVLPDSDSHRRLLADANLGFAVCDDGLLLLGDASWNHADLFHVASRQLLPHGQLLPNDPIARQLLATLIDSVLPKSEQSGELCMMSSAGLASNFENIDFFNRVVRLRGYEPLLVPSGAALVLSELVQSTFTGIALVFGASACEAVLAHRGLVVCQSQLPRGGDWIDEQLADCFNLACWDPSGERFLDTVSVCHARESDDPTHRAALAIDPEFPAAAQAALSGLMTDLLTTFSDELMNCQRALDLPQPLALLCGGGLAQSERFIEYLHHVLAQSRLPVSTRQARVARGWPHNILRGLLIAGELEAATASELPQQRRAA